MLKTFKVVGTNTPENVSSLPDPSTLGRPRSLRLLSVLDSLNGPAESGTWCCTLSSVPSCTPPSSLSRLFHRKSALKKLEGIEWCWRLAGREDGGFNGSYVRGESICPLPCDETCAELLGPSSSADRDEKFGVLQDIDSPSVISWI